LVLSFFLFSLADWDMRSGRNLKAFAQMSVAAERKIGRICLLSQPLRLAT